MKFRAHLCSPFAYSAGVSIVMVHLYTATSKLFQLYNEPPDPITSIYAFSELSETLQNIHCTYSLIYTADMHMTTKIYGTLE